MEKIEMELSAISHSGDKNYEYHINTILGVLRKLVDAHNELLETHTVKENENRINKPGYHVILPNTPSNSEKEEIKEEPTTPEKTSEFEAIVYVTDKDGKQELRTVIVNPGQSSTPEKDERVWLTIKDMDGNEKIRMAYKADVDALEHPMGNPKKETATPEKKCCGVCKPNGVGYCNNLLSCPCHQETATPEKKCVCGEQEILGGAEVEIGGVCHRPNNPCYIIEETKLPTSSYEVTCGRCEKSIKHSCGL